jgi:hypothetical protein
VPTSLAILHCWTSQQWHPEISTSPFNLFSATPMAEPTPASAPAKPAQPAQPAKPKSQLGRIVIFGSVLVVVLAVLFLCFTESGINCLMGVLDAGSNMMVTGDPAKEKAAADELEKLDISVIRETDFSAIAEGKEEMPKDNLPKKVTSIAAKTKTLNPKIFEHIPNLYRILVLNFTETDLNDEQLKKLTGLSMVTSLQLNGTKITDAGLAEVAKLQKIESLTMPGTAVSDAGVAQLTTMPNLKILDLSNTKITDSCLKDIAKCDSINWLLIQSVPVTDEGIQALGKMTHLSRLSAGGTQVTQEGIAKLRKLLPKTVTLAAECGPIPQSSFKPMADTVSATPEDSAAPDEAAKDEPTADEMKDEQADEKSGEEPAKE